MESIPETPVPLDFVQLIHQPDWKSILLDLVKSNKMEAWNIDISQLADLYLQKINAMQTASLRLPANAILCSALLLKFKAKTLQLPSMEDWEDELNAQESEEDIKKQQKLFLEEGFPELIAPRMMREGKVSLDDLVTSLESILAVTRRKRVLEQQNILSFEIPHAEQNIEERMGTVFKEVSHWLAQDDLLLFSQLTKHKKQEAIVHTFIPLLFLANQKKILLWQDEFFGEIFISKFHEKEETEEKESEAVNKETTS